MKSITLSKPWDHITPEKTIAYPAGTFSVTDEIASAAEKAGVIKETKDGGGTGAAGKASGAGKTEG